MSLMQRLGVPLPKRRRITFAPSPALAYLTPWISIALASMATGWPTIAQMPLMPPLGYLFLLGWRQLHPGLLPVWAGCVLGLVDDLFNGLPFGTAIFLWAVTMLALDVIEARFPWRNFAVEWALAGGMIALYVVFSAAMASGGFSRTLLLLGPQLALAVLAYPLVGRVVAWLDHARLRRFRVW